MILYDCLQINLCYCVEVPIASVWPHSQSYLIGSSISLTCTADGYPLPQYVWKHNGFVLPKSERIAYDEIAGILTITELTREDSGEYECVATNSAGRGTAVAHLNYMGENCAFTWKKISLS